MKNRLSYLLFSFFFSLSISGCGDDLAAPETEDELVPITFSSNVSTSVDAETTTKAQTKGPEFPNNGSIAVVAANATSTAIKTEGWAESNLYLKHLEAETNVWKDSSFPVTFKKDTTYYWSFNPNEYLTFAAYSPFEDKTMTKKEDTKLQLEVDTTNAKFPDLLYSTPTPCWNKTHGDVSLTQFKHAMARLVIRVVGVNKEGVEIKDYSNAANLKITKLKVLTKVTKGAFDFTTPNWTLTDPATDFHILHNFDFTAADKGKLPYDSSKEQEIYILPSINGVNTTELSKIEFNIEDAVFTYGKPEGYSIFDFKDDKDAPVLLKMGETTVLTFKIKVMEISSGDTNDIVLKGNLADWDYKGNSSVTIN